MKIMYIRYGFDVVLNLGYTEVGNHNNQTIRYLNEIEMIDQESRLDYNEVRVEYRNLFNFKFLNPFQSRWLHILPS